MNETEKSKAYEKLTPERKALLDRVLENLNKGDGLWQQGWINTGVPTSGITGKKYHGKFNNLTDKRKGTTEKYPTTILSFPKAHPSKSNHPTEKPISLLEFLIKTYTNRGDVVLDNAMGCGNTIIACINTERHYIGYEIERKYYELAKERIEKGG